VSCCYIHGVFRCIPLCFLFLMQILCVKCVGVGVGMGVCMCVCVHVNVHMNVCLCVTSVHMTVFACVFVGDLTPAVAMECPARARL